ncbi:MAG: maleylpyruvate isomerase N-terminal domain-containing protein [Dehalococcoidia bacterium]
MATKEELVSGIREQGERAQRLASQLDEEDWQRGVHEAGWNVKQAFCHLASTAGGAGFVISVVNQQQASSGEGAGGGPGAGFDINEFNTHQVGLREARDPEELLTELRDGNKTSQEAVSGLDDAFLDLQARSFADGSMVPARDLMQLVMVDHVRGHLDEIEKITGKG